MSTGKTVVLALTFVIAVPALILSLIGINLANHVISSRIDDGTIEEQDLKDILSAGIKLPDGQVLDTSIMFKDKNGVDPSVLGLTTDQGLWRVIVGQDALFVDPPTGGVDGDTVLDGSLTGADIADNSIGADKIIPSIVSSVDGVVNDGGNIDLTEGFGINIVSSDAANTIGISVDQADLDPIYVNVTGDTMTGPLTINSNLNVTGNTTLNNLVVNGTSEHFGPEIYHDYIDAQGSIKNTTGNLVLDDTVDVTGDLNVAGTTTTDYLIVNSGSEHYGLEKYYAGLNVYDSTLYGNPGALLDWYGNAYIGDTGKFVDLYGNINFFPDSVTENFGNFHNYGDFRTDGDVWLGNGNNDRVVVPGPISSGDADPLTIEDNSGLIVTRRDNPAVQLFHVDGNGLAYFYNDVTVGGNVLPSLDNTYDLGSPSLRWANVYANNFNGCLTSPAGSSYCDDAYIDGTLTVNGESYHNSDEHFYGLVDAQGGITNTTGSVVDINDVEGTTISTSTGANRIENTDGNNVIINTNGNNRTVNSTGNNVLTNTDGANRLINVNGNNALLNTFGNNRVETDFGNNVVRNTFGTNAIRNIFGDNVFSSLAGINHFTNGDVVIEDMLYANSGAVSNGNILPSVDNTYDLGSPALRWANLYATNINGCTTSPAGSTYCDDAYVSGSLTVDGDTVLNNNVILGDNPADGIVFTGEVNSDILPIADNTFDLGSASLRWANLFVTGVNGCVTSPAGSVYCDNASIVGNTILGDAAGDTVTFNGRVNSNILPATNATYDLGTGALRFQDGFFSDSVRVGAPGLQNRYEDNQILAVGQDLNLSAQGAQVVNINDDTNISGVTNFGGGYGSTGVTIDTVGNVLINGKLTVDGTIDPTDIILTPNEAQVAIDVKANAGGGASNFTVDENGNVVANGDVTVGGQLDADNIQVNAQLSVNDLVVTNSASITGDIISDLIPDVTNTRSLGTATYRWANVYGVNGRFSGTLFVAGTNVANALSTLNTDVATLQTNVGNLQTSVGNLQTDVTSLQGAVTALQARKQATGGIDSGCSGSATNATPVTCVVNVGTAFDSFTATPVGAGANLKIKIAAYTPGVSTTATVSIYGEAGGSSVSGVSWVAIY